MISKYEGKLPAARIPASALINLEKILRDGCLAKIKQSIEIRYNGFSKSYNRVDELLSDPIKPKEIKNFYWRFFCDKGEVWLYATEEYCKFTIYGDDAWVKKKKEDILLFINQYKSIARRIINEYCVYILFQLGILLLGLAIVPLWIFNSNFLERVLLLIFGLLLLVIWYLTEFRKIIPLFSIEFEESRTKLLCEQIIIGVISSLIASGIIALLYITYKQFFGFL